MQVAWIETTLLRWHGTEVLPVVVTGTNELRFWGRLAPHASPLDREQSEHQASSRRVRAMIAISFQVPAQLSSKYIQD